MMSAAGDPTLELGDACIAAPFTYKFTSLKSVSGVIDLIFISSLNKVVVRFDVSITKL